MTTILSLDVTCITVAFPAHPAQVAQVGRFSAPAQSFVQRQHVLDGSHLCRQQLPEAFEIRKRKV